jgi:hypothetical protein
MIRKTSKFKELKGDDSYLAPLGWLVGSNTQLIGTLALIQN